MPFRDKDRAVEWQRQYRKAHPDKYKRDRQRATKRSNEVDRLRRQDPAFRHKFIVRDSKRRDKEAGRVTSLNEEWVKNLISTGCTYCGATELIRMTLDRKDNSLGYTQDNVVPACIRCNLIRRDMPYVAWLCLVDGLRKAHNDGLFGGWTGELHQRPSQHL